MSVVQRVIVLNKPFKIRGYTVFQWVILAVGVALAFFLGAKVPHDWKLGNLPVGLFVGMLIFSGAAGFVTLTQLRPFAWWYNMVAFRIGLVERLYLPHPEEGPIYPDPTIIEPTKREEDTYHVPFDDWGSTDRDV